MGSHLNQKKANGRILTNLNNKDLELANPTTVRQNPSLSPNEERAAIPFITPPSGRKLRDKSFMFSPPSQKNYEGQNDEEVADDKLKSKGQSGNATGKAPKVQQMPQAEEKSKVPKLRLERIRVEEPEPVKSPFQRGAKIQQQAKGLELALKQALTKKVEEEKARRLQ